MISATTHVALIGAFLIDKVTSDKIKFWRIHFGPLT
jgi:hypothetical protein